MTRLRDAGHALAFVSHRLEEVLAITDRVTVLREGRTVAAGLPTRGLTQPDIIKLMAGREMGAIYGQSPRRPARRRTGRAGNRTARRAARVRDVSFQAWGGEILGLGGLVGAGAPKPSKRCSACARVARASSAWTDGPFIPQVPRRPCAPASASCPKTAVRKTSCRISASKRTCCWRTWARIAASDEATPQADRRGAVARRAGPAAASLAGYRHAGALRRHAAEDTHRALAADRTQGVDS